MANPGFGQRARAHAAATRAALDEIRKTRRPVKKANNSSTTRAASFDHSIQIVCDYNPRKGRKRGNGWTRRKGAKR